MTTEEIAALLLVHVQTIRAAIKEGLPCIRVGRAYRFDPDKVIAWAESQVTAMIGDDMKLIDQVDAEIERAG